MTDLDRYFAWWVQFNRSAADRNWNRIAPYLTDDAVYEVKDTPFACRLSGREAVMLGFDKSLGGFDYRFGVRRQSITSAETLADGRIKVLLWTEYEREGAPRFGFPAMEYATLRDGRIAHLINPYAETESDNAAAYAWLAEHGADLDPSYV